MSYANQPTPDFEREAETRIKRYPVSRRSAALPLLHLWQETFGYISEQGIEWIARKLNLESISILELATFYPMFRRRPFGKIHIKVCRTLSCELRGNREIFARLLELTRVEGEPHSPMHSPDGKFSLEFVECLACCGTAPVLMINDDLFENVTPSALESLIGKYE
jgi:NADH-quinone oxidoreductase subunit E